MELVGQTQLLLGAAGGSHEQAIMITVQQRPADTDAEHLLPQILQRAKQQPHGPGPAARQGARDAVHVVAQLGCGDPNSLLRFLGCLDTAKSVGDGGGRKPRRLRYLADRRALACLGHRSQPRVCRTRTSPPWPGHNNSPCLDGA